MTESVFVRRHERAELRREIPRLQTYIGRGEQVSPARHLAWLTVLEQGLLHQPYCLEAVVGDQTAGVLPLAFVSSFLFGRFLVSLPYVNTGGVFADNTNAGTAMITCAIQLADELSVRYLELRHEQPFPHPSLIQPGTGKVHMRLELPRDEQQLWKGLSSKVRNQVRKGQKSGLDVHWGGVDLLPEFYAVFSHNMRDLGTPVYSRKLFQGILDQFSHASEICVVRSGQIPIAAGILVHGRGITEVPSASSLKSYNSTCANMLLYWELLSRAIARGQSVFDFGRSTQDGTTYRFKKQWGANPHPAEWQYYVRQGIPSDMRRDSDRFQVGIRLWQRLPINITRLIGPAIVRGIP